MTGLSCINCRLRLYGAVKYCPFCGSPQSAEGSVVIAAPREAQKSQPPPLPAAAMPIKSETIPVKPLKDSGQSKDTSKAVAESSIPLMPEPKSTSDYGMANKVKASKASDPLSDIASPPDKSSSKWIIVSAVALLLAVGAYFLSAPSKQEVACNSSLTDASGQFTAGNILGARNLTLKVLASCSGKVKERATMLLAQIDKASTAKTGCDKLIRAAEGHFSDRRLTSARSSLDQLDDSCTESTPAKTLRQRIAESQTISLAIETDLRSQINQGNVKSARAALDQLIAQNRENPELPKYRDEIQALARSTEASTPAPPLPTPPPEPPAANRAAAGQPEMAQTFVRDAELALSQLKFDTARTFAESARRMDPNNAQASNLLRRIKEKELQYLRDETTIK